MGRVLDLMRLFKCAEEERTNDSFHEIYLKPTLHDMIISTHKISTLHSQTSASHFKKWRKTRG
jgi:hypothetical protein